MTIFSLVLSFAVLFAAFWVAYVRDGWRGLAAVVACFALLALTFVTA